MGKRAESILDTSRSNGCPALGRIESPPRPRMAAVLRPSPNDRGSATHLQERLLGDVPKFPLVPMECGSRGRPSYDGRIPSTQTLREPATVGGSDVADGAHSPRDLAVRPVHRPRRPGILPLATGVLRKLLRWARWRGGGPRGGPFRGLPIGSRPARWVGKTVGAGGAPGWVDALWKRHATPGWK